MIGKLKQRKKSPTFRSGDRTFDYSFITPVLQVLLIGDNATPTTLVG